LIDVHYLRAAGVTAREIIERRAGASSQPDVKGIDKEAIKARMRDLKKRRESALETHDHALLKAVRRELHHYNRQIRQHLH